MRKHQLSHLLAATCFLVNLISVDAQKPSQAKPVWNGRPIMIADPNVRISYDGNVAHMEAYITASTDNPNLLLACSEMIVSGRELQASEARLYYSTDAGARWTPVLLPDEITGGWDNAVAAGPEGVIYFLTSNLQNGLTVYSSSDTGKTWKSTIITRTKGWDRPHMIVDNTKGSYRGRLYIVGETGKGISAISSSDGGATFTSPVIACASSPELNMATSANPMVLSDGTLLVSCVPYPNYPARATWREAETGLVASTDGGQTFSSYHKAFTIQRQLPKEYFPARNRGHVLLTGNFMQGPFFAASPAGSPFADRIYAAWQDIDSIGHAQLLFAWSGDRGLTWNGPRAIDRARPAKGNTGFVQQGAPMLAINTEGVVGVAWLDDRHAADHKGYDTYFTASVDGGINFLPSTKISSVTSQPARAGQNTLPSFLAGKPGDKGERSITIVSPFSTRSTGGDYATMAVDAAGRFHPLWLDDRDNMGWQLYTSTVRVIPEGLLKEAAEKRSSASGKEPCVLDDRIQLLFGEPRWSIDGKEVIMPVSLFNASADILTEPISVQVSGATLLSSRARTYATEVVMPEFFDPIQSAFSDSAKFTYPISHQAPLFPNGVSSSLNWRIRIAAPEWIDFTWKVIVSRGQCLQVK
jgi:hypothetical protein